MKAIEKISSIRSSACRRQRILRARRVRQLRLDRALGTLREFFDQLGHVPAEMPGQPVEAIPHGGADVERDMRQAFAMAVPIPPLPFGTAYRHGNTSCGVTSVTLPALGMIAGP